MRTELSGLVAVNLVIVSAENRYGPDRVMPGAVIPLGLCSVKWHGWWDDRSTAAAENIRGVSSSVERQLLID